MTSDLAGDGPGLGACFLLGIHGESEGLTLDPTLNGMLKL